MSKVLLIIVYLYNTFNLLGQSTELRNEFISTSKYFKTQEYSKALKSNNIAINLSISEFGSNHLTTATLLENKGRILLKLNMFKDSETYLKKSYKIRKNLLEKYDPDIAEVLNYLSLSLRKQGKYEAAITLHNQVLGIMAKVIANNPGQISELSRRSALYKARAMHTKGDFYKYYGKNEQARGNYTTALKIYERTLGKNKQELEQVLRNLNNLD